MSGWYVDEYLEKAKTEKTTIEESNKAWESLGQKLKCLEAMNNNLIGALERPTGPIARYRRMDKMEKKTARKEARFYFLRIGLILALLAYLFIAKPGWGAEKKTLYYQDDAGKESVVGEIWVKDNVPINPNIAELYIMIDPCDQPHEIEVEHDVMSRAIDWGSKNCRFIILNDAYIFNVSPGSVEIGFRNDGIMVWRYGKEK